MTVSSSTSKVQYNGNGSLTVFAYTFRVFDQDDLTVIIRSANGTETTKSIGTHYTVSGVGDAGGGNVTMLTAPASGETITILREQPLTQGLDLVPNDPFPAGSLEDALDKLTFMVQSHSEELDRAIKASKTNTIGSTEFTISAADRATKVFAFDENGELAVTQELGVYRGGWSASTAYSVRDLVKDSSNSNIYICITGHTSSGSQPISSNADAAKWGLIVDAAAADASASAAAASEAAAAASAAAALASETAADASETAAAASQSAAAASQSAAATSASSASTSATAAASSATAASGSASSASTSAANAATSATSAANSATTATTQATNAAASASTASTAATTATTQASAASASASAAASSASAASSSASSAASSASSASASADAALAALDNFDDRYLGQKASDPTLDNDGNALIAGALYFNTTDNSMKVYDGSQWLAAYSSLESIQDLSDVSAMTPTEGQALVYSSGFWTAADMSGGIAYTRKTANYTASANEGIIADTSGGSFTVTLPASPATGDTVMVVDGNDWSTTNLIVGRNGSTIEGDASDLTCDVGAVAIQFTYDGTTWQIYTQAGSYGANLSDYLPLSGGTLTGALSGTSLTMTGAANFGAEVVEATYNLTGTALDPSNGTIQYTTLSANTTLTDSLAAGESITLMIDDGSAYTITWPTMTWVNNGGAAPTLATSGYTVVALWKVSTTLYGALVGDGS